MRLLTFGTFDTPHMGHAVFLRKCARLGDVTVAVRSDEMVRQLRGHDPIFTYTERAELVKALGYEVVQSGERGRLLINLTKPDLIAVGSDWADRDVFERYSISPDELERWSVTLVYLPYTSGISTTEIKERLRG